MPDKFKTSKDKAKKRAKPYRGERTKKNKEKKKGMY
jgi:hypothetical protein